MTILGILGAGRLGTAVARLARGAGYDVILSGSPRQPMLGLIVETLIPGARLLSEAEVVAGADLVLLAIPFAKLDSLDLDALAGRIVIDALNPWPAVDGTSSQPSSAASSSEAVLGRNPSMRLVKAFNHLGYLDLEADARPAGSALRRAMGVASDDVAARSRVAHLVDAVGFDPVLLGLAEGRLLEPDGPVFGRALDAVRFGEALRESQYQPWADLNAQPPHGVP